jgi:hypothetical protein
MSALLNGFPDDPIAEDDMSHSSFVFDVLHFLWKVLALSP